MKRLVRILLPLLAAGSLLIGVAAVVLWKRSYGRPPDEEDRVSIWVRSKQSRYTIRSDRGRLTLYAPPPAPPAGQSAKTNESAETLAAQLSNQQMLWEIQEEPPNITTIPLRQPVTGTPNFGHTPPYKLLVGRSEYDNYPPAYSDSQLAPALLVGLEDADRFAAAHVVLTRVFPVWSSGIFEERPDGSGVHRIDDLRVEILPPASGTRGVSSYNYLSRRMCLVTIEPGQRIKLRDQWHRRLDVAVASAPHWAVAAVTLIPGLASLRLAARLWARHAHRRRGHCLVCSYDLTASPVRCPECGTPVAPAQATLDTLSR